MNLLESLLSGGVVTQQTPDSRMPEQGTVLMVHGLEMACHGLRSQVMGAVGHRNVKLLSRPQYAAEKRGTSCRLRQGQANRQHPGTAARHAAPHDAQVLAPYQSMPLGRQFSPLHMDAQIQSAAQLVVLNPAPPSDS